MEKAMRKSLVHWPWKMNTDCVSHAAHERLSIILINTKTHQKLTEWEAHVDWWAQVSNFHGHDVIFF